MRLQRTRLFACPLRWVVAASLCMLAVTSRPAFADPPPKVGAAEDGIVVVHCTDGSVFRVRLVGEPIEIVTAHGTLRVPVANVRHVQCGLRLSAADQAAIDRAIADLAQPELQVQEKGRAVLREYGAAAYPALLRASTTDGTQVAKRFRELLAEIEADWPPERPLPTDKDVVETVESKIIGRISASAMTVETAQFGRQSLHLQDVERMESLVWLGNRDAEDAPGEVVLADPGHLKAYEAMHNKTFAFQVTGAVVGNVWGTGVYTTDSPLATAAVHAGAVKIGETGTVRVKIVPPPRAFSGSIRNGVSSYDYGEYGGAYEILRTARRRLRTRH